jgi:hypothetical protein
MLLKYNSTAPSQSLRVIAAIENRSLRQPRGRSEWLATCNPHSCGLAFHGWQVNVAMGG